MDIRQIRYFIATAEELNFTRAAHRCNVSQPPLSRAIAQLEEEIGTRLFVRDSHRVSLTSAGESLIGDARRALEMIEGGVQRAKRVASGLRGTLSIGFGGTPAYWLWPIMVREFRQTAPDVQIKFVAMPVLDQIDALSERRIDLGVVRLPVHDEMLQTFPIHSEPLVVAMSDAHSEIGLSGQPIRMEQLAGTRFITYAPRRGFDYRLDLNALCRLAGFEPDIAHEGETTEAIVGMVACSEGIAVLPGDARRLNMHGVVFRDLDVTQIPARLASVEFALAWNAEHEVPVVREFVQQAVEKLRYALPAW